MSIFAITEEWRERTRERERYASHSLRTSYGTRKQLYNFHLFLRVDIALFGRVRANALLQQNKNMVRKYKDIAIFLLIEFASGTSEGDKQGSENVTYGGSSGIRLDWIRVDCD